MIAPIVPLKLETLTHIIGFVALGYRAKLTTRTFLPTKRSCA